MISPVSNSTPLHTPAAAPAPAPAPAPAAPQDSVHLSHQAHSAAGGDMDHDGDSH